MSQKSNRKNFVDFVNGISFLLILQLDDLVTILEEDPDNFYANFE